ncbi:hypothetical protein JDV09_24635 [Mycobacterium sp. Y57]|uniref:hypothetical protein n=1 Tax=Mycolicibacterium xanthum TaxID=2796469 RepID=UPI001C859459|nr:hypothetical protein [Mycolicibacterium xanthum]MBX7435261.1 hypothetical protein [Mycolicibacterium xanthum]
MTTRPFTKLGMIGIAVLAAAAGAVALSGTAGADVNEIGPNPRVTSDQADSVKRNATFGEVRGSDILEVRGEGEVRDSLMAVPGTRARGFRGGWSTGIQGGLR